MLGYLDSFKSTRQSGGSITKISQTDSNAKSVRVAVVIEKEAIREKIVSTLQKHGLNNVDWVSSKFSLGPTVCAEEEPTTHYFFYDLSVNTLTFEFLFSFVHADAERRRLGKDSLHVVIVPQRTDSIFDFSRQSIRRTNNEAYLECDNSWFMHNVIIPSVALMPSCSGVTQCGHRSEAKLLAENQSGSCFPEQYDVDNPIELNSAINITNEAVYDGAGYGQPLKSSEVSLAFIRQWFKAKGLDCKRVLLLP